MSRKTCRQAVASYFGGGAVTGLNQVTRAKQRNLKPGAYFAGTSKTGAIAYVYMEGEREARRSGPTGLGHKQVTYTVGLRVTFRSTLNDNEAAIDAYDDTLEAIKARLRADPTLGTGPGGVVFQAGEGDTSGGDDIEVVSDDTREVNNTTTVEAVVRFLLVEFITA